MYTQFAKSKTSYDKTSHFFRATVPLSYTACLTLASLTMPDEGPMLKVPAPWPWAFRVYRISRSAKDLAFTTNKGPNVKWQFF